MELIKEGTINTEDCKVTFLTCGSQFGMGFEAAVEAARAAKAAGQLVIAFVIRPSEAAGQEAAAQTKEGICVLRKEADTVFLVTEEETKVQAPEAELLQPAGIFGETVSRYMKSIVELIKQNSQINLDFDDLKTVLQGKGIGYLGWGTADGADRCMKAVRQAAENPFCGTKLNGADNAILYLSGDITFVEATEAADYVQEQVKEDATIIFGCAEEETLADTVHVIILATDNEDSMY